MDEACVEATRTHLLSRLLEQMPERNRTDLVERIKKVSPVAWRHVDLKGRYQLKRQEDKIDIDLIIATLQESLTQCTT